MVRKVFIFLILFTCLFSVVSCGDAVEDKDSRTPTVSLSVKKNKPFFDAYSEIPNENGDGKYKLYFFNVGTVDGVPLVTAEAYRYTGVDIDVSYTIEETNEEGIQEAIERTVNNVSTVSSNEGYVITVGKEDSNTGTVDYGYEAGESVEIGTSITGTITVGAEASIGSLGSVKQEVSLSGTVSGSEQVSIIKTKNWGEEFSKTNSVEKANSYDKSTSNSEEIGISNAYSTYKNSSYSKSKTFTFHLNSNIEQGWYRYALFSLCDLYMVLIIDTANMTAYTTYNMYPVKDSFYYGIQYSKDGKFNNELSEKVEINLNDVVDYLNYEPLKNSDNNNHTDFICKHNYVDFICSKCGYYEATEGINFELISDGLGYSVVGYTGSSDVVLIPSKYNDVPVIEINKNAFDGLDNIKKVFIPNTVTTIGSLAFANCSSLTSIVIPNSVTTIGEIAFWNCSSLTSVVIPNSVTTISSFVFSNCSSLTSIVIPESVTCIGEAAFNKCSSLTSIVIPNSVTIIEDSAFNQCINLKNVILSQNLTSINNSTFANCSNLETITLPDGINRIGPSAFADCSNLKTITLPKSLIDIEYHAFLKCSSLKRIFLPNGVQNIGTSAFIGCSNLESINIPTSVNNIGSSLFYGCSNLEIFCETTSKTSGWDDDWNIEGRPVYWKGEWAYNVNHNPFPLI